MAKFTNELNNYQNIPRKLVFDTNLSDRARFVYCFMACKPNDWDFYLEPMAKDIGYSVDTLRKYINELIEGGWLEKGEQERDNGVFGAVSYTLKATKNTDTEKTRYGKIPTQHNIDDKQIIDSINKEKEGNKLSSQKNFNFKQALLDLGVCENVANDFLLVRKNKKATSSETAFKRIQTEIAKSGLSANDCITIAVENDWKGFRAEWIQKQNRKYSIEAFSSYSPKNVSGRAGVVMNTLTVPVKMEKNGIKYLSDGTYVENGKRYYTHRIRGKIEVSMGAVARPNEDWEWNSSTLTWEQDERTITISDMLF